MSIRKLRAGRVPSVTAEQFIGENGTIFWDEGTGTLRLSDGHTPGGYLLSVQTFTSNNVPDHPSNGNLWFDGLTGKLYIYFDSFWVDTQPVYTLPVANDTTLGGIKPDGGFTVDPDGTLHIDFGPMFELDNAGKFQLKPGTDAMIGGIKPGPGVVIDSTGTLLIDTAGLPFSFGDFNATTPGNGAATLSAVNADQDVAIVSNGTGVINMVGNFHVHRTQDYDPSQPDLDGAVFAIKTDGQIQMKVPLADATTAALEIIGNDTGLFVSPNQTGVIIHVTGNSGLVSRNYFDANANYVILAGRRYNGTQSAPRRVLNNETLLRVVSQGAVAATNGADATFNTFGPARISFYANEDQTPTAQGGRIAFEVTKNGTAADTVGTNTITAAYIDAQNGITATKFVGPLTGNVTGKADTAGNADTVTNGVYTNGSYANPSWITSLAASKVGLGNVTNESKATMFTSPTFTGTVAGVTKTMVGLSAVENTALSTSTHYIGTTSITYNRASASQTLTGVSIDGNAGTVTNGVYTTDTGTVTNTMLAGSIANNKLSNSTISGVALGGSLANLTAGYGISFSTGTTYNGSAAITINRYEGVTTASATGSGGNGWTYSLNLGTASGLNFIDVGGNFSGTVTITGTPVVGRITRLVITGGIKGPTTVTVSGLTAANSSNGTAQFLATSGTASSVIVEFYSSTTALSGVYMNCSGAK